MSFRFEFHIKYSGIPHILGAHIFINKYILYLFFSTWSKRGMLKSSIMMLFVLITFYCPPFLLYTFFIWIYLFIYIYFLAVLGLRFCARAFSSCSKRGPLFIAVRGPLTVVASLVAEHSLQTRRLSGCGSRA